MRRLIRLFNTVKHLKAKQFYFRLYYGVKNRCLRYAPWIRCYKRNSLSNSVRLIPSIESPESYREGTFTFLNLSVNFGNKIDWNYSKNGKLWTYNLTYFDFLLQKNITREAGLELMHSFLEKPRRIRAGMDAYPISLRGINWIKFLSYYDIEDKHVQDHLYAQYYMLYRNVEYHVLGNHVLENGISLLWGAYYFQDTSLYQRGRDIVIGELREQVLSDGAHFELSPMYHLLILYRILDTINLVKHNKWGNDKELRQKLLHTAGLMLGWLKNILYSDMSVPLLNDAASGSAPDPKVVLEYASRLQVPESRTPLSESGYRKFYGRLHELLVDAGPLGPDYQPGHAHCDMLHFELRVHGLPFIIDVGTSTYEANERRAYEKSTEAHNTVRVEGTEQSELWSSFRVARRAKIDIDDERPNYVKAAYSNYADKQRSHCREFYNKPDSVHIIDSSRAGAVHSEAFLHFDASVHIEIKGSEIRTKHARIQCEGASNIRITPYSYAAGFNSLRESKMAVISFKGILKTTIMIQGS